MNKINLKQYLDSSEFIDCNCPEIIELAKTIKEDFVSDLDVARACFEYVRDTVKHTSDYKIDIITCKASDVLRHKTGYCYAKSHLLAALLRANNIPAGLCYQRLSFNDDGAPYCLHGLNAVYLQDFGWYRIDARGNKEGVDAQFFPPKEQLAFDILSPLEADLQGIWPEPLEAVVNVLQGYETYIDVNANIPDIEIY